MSINIKKIKIQKNKAGIDIPNFLIRYDYMATNKGKKQASYEIISLLKQKRDIIIQVKTELLTMVKSNREDYYLEFIKQINKLGLNYRNKKLPPSKRNLFSFEFLEKQTSNYESFIHVPNSTWENEEFFNLIPIYGVKYYFIDDNIDINKILDDLHNYIIDDNELSDFFKLIIFDCATLGHMGVYSKYLSIDNLKNLIGL